MSLLEQGTCEVCWGSGGHSTYEEDAQDLVTHTCTNCNGTGRTE